jgi:guanylate kinase
MENLPVEDIALLMILAGPAGSGKTTLCERIVADKNRIERLVTCTTRQPRENEIDGVDYHFLSNEAFDEKIETGAFLEWAKVHTNRYGTLKSVIEGKLAEQIDLVMNIDVQGVATVREAAKSHPTIEQRLVTVFIMPSDFDELRQRLRGRGQDDEAEIDRRIQSAEAEVKQWNSFDYVIRSKSKDEDYGAIRSIWQAEKRKASRLG